MTHSLKLEPIPDVVLSVLNRHLKPATHWRWRTRGIATPNGRVRLRAQKCGATWYTCRAWFQEFLDAQSASCPQECERTPETERRLRELGLLR